MCGSMTCYTSIPFHMFSYTGGFCDLLISSTRNEIGIIKAFAYHKRDRAILISSQTRGFVTFWDRFITMFFCQPKIFFQMFSTRPTRQRPGDIISTSFHTFHWKSIQNGSYGDVKHVRYRRSRGKYSKWRKFALFVKEKGRNGCENIRRSRKILNPG